MTWSASSSRTAFPSTSGMDKPVVTLSITKVVEQMPGEVLASIGKMVAELRELGAMVKVSVAVEPQTPGEKPQ